MGRITIQSGLTIQEVSERLELPKSTLRYWEQQLGPSLQPKRTSGGQRRYTEKHIQMFERVKTLKSNGKKIAEIKHILELEMTFLNPSGLITQHSVELLASRIADLVSHEVSNFLGNKLTGR